MFSYTLNSHVLVAYWSIKRYSPLSLLFSVAGRPLTSPLRTQSSPWAPTLVSRHAGWPRSLGARRTGWGPPRWSSSSPGPSFRLWSGTPAGLSSCRSPKTTPSLLLRRWHLSSYFEDDTFPPTSKMTPFLLSSLDAYVNFLKLHWLFLAFH